MWPSVALCKTRENSVEGKSAVGFRVLPPPPPAPFLFCGSCLQKELLVVLILQLEKGSWRLEHSPGLTFRELL